MSTFQPPPLSLLEAPQTTYGRPASSKLNKTIDAIRNNSSRAGAVIGILVVATIVMAFYVIKYKGKCVGMADTKKENMVGCTTGSSCKLNACRTQWDPAAVAEAQGLATAGQFLSSGTAMAQLDHAIDGSMSDDALVRIAY